MASCNWLKVVPPREAHGAQAVASGLPAGVPARAPERLMAFSGRKARARPDKKIYFSSGNSRGSLRIYSVRGNPAAGTLPAGYQGRQESELCRRNQHTRPSRPQPSALAISRLPSGNARPTSGPFYSVTFRRSYEENGKWHDTDSFGRDNLLLLAKLADMAHSWIFQRLAQSPEHL